MSKLEVELGRFETRFGVKSAEFYEAMMRGDLEEFYALDEYRMEFIEWLALHKTWLSLDELAVADPHHKHVAPDIKHHRVPAPELSFTRPNLPFLIS